jgi:hypothetical protein
VVVAVGGTLLACAPSFGASPLLQHGFAALGTLGSFSLALVMPALMDLAPPEGLAALLKPMPDPALTAPAEAAMRATVCAAAQAASVAVGCVLLAVSLYRTEVRQRKAFLVAEATRHGLLAPARG